MKNVLLVQQLQLVSHPHYWHRSNSSSVGELFTQSNMLLICGRVLSIWLGKKLNASLPPPRIEL